MKRIIRLTTLIVGSLNIPTTDGSVITISDERARSLDAVPVLGRGYSTATNSFRSTCLMVEEVTTPSYNYDCKCLVSQTSTL